MNKKAYIKTVEAFIAIIAILIFIYAIIPDRSIEEPKIPPVVESSQKFITTEIQTDEDIRTCVIENPQCNNSQMMQQVIEDNLPVGYDSTFKICEDTNCIAQTPFDRSVYLTDVFIISTLEQNNPKVVKIWIWRKD